MSTERKTTQRGRGLKIVAFALTITLGGAAGAAAGGLFFDGPPNNVAAEPSGPVTTSQPVAWAVNESGDTYGSILAARSPDDVPVLMQVEEDGVQGYVYSAELAAVNGENVGSPEEAILHQERTQGVYSESIRLPMYKSDGKTQIGWFRPFKK